MYFKHAFIWGGTRSGKSAFAESLVTFFPKPWIYLASAESFDAEMAERIQTHTKRRGSGWSTIEAPRDVAGAIEEVPQGATVLFDCATLWLSNHMGDESDLAAEIEALLKAIETGPARVVTVSNEVGQGIVPANALARRFRDEQGALNQRLAAAAELAVFVTAGLPMVLKGSLPEGFA